VPSVPVPEVANVTTILDEDVDEDVAVSVTVVPEFSARDVADMASVITGVLSSSTIVNVTLWVPDSAALPPETPEIEVMMVSFDSESESFVMVNVFVPVVDPAAMVIVVPLTAE
jgi:hypothetical protein